MAQATIASTAFSDAIQDVALSQMLDSEMGRLAKTSYYAKDIDEIRGTLLGIAAMAEKSVSLNAKASEALQALQDRFDELERTRGAKGGAA